jgi:hypothetical protein
MSSMVLLVPAEQNLIHLPPSPPGSLHGCICGGGAGPAPPGGLFLHCSQWKVSPRAQVIQWTCPPQCGSLREDPPPSLASAFWLEHHLPCLCLEPLEVPVAVLCERIEVIK